MNLLFLHSSSDLYGASRIMLQTIELCQRENHNVTVCLSEPGELKTELEKVGAEVQIVRLGILRRKYSSVLGLINRMFYIVKATATLCTLIRRKKIDIVYNNTSSIIAGCFAAKLTRTNHLWHIHEIVSSPKIFAKFITYMMTYLTDKNIVVSEATKSHWVSLNPKLADKIRVINNGIETERFESGKGPESPNELLKLKEDSDENLVWIGMIGRVHFWKGQSYFLDIASEILKQKRNVKFVMAGDAFPGYEHLYDELKEKIVELKIEEHVLDLGFVADASKFYEMVDIFVLPSILPDPFPTVVLEAMASNKPCVVTAHGGATEMVMDGESGIHIPFDQAHEACKKILPIIENEQLRMEIANKGNRRLKEVFSKEKYYKLVLNELETW